MVVERLIYGDKCVCNDKVVLQDLFYNAVDMCVWWSLNNYITNISVLYNDTSAAIFMVYMLYNRYLTRETNCVDQTIPAWVVGCALDIK